LRLPPFSPTPSDSAMSRSSGFFVNKVIQHTSVILCDSL
jgi:hypothetical protein